MYSNQPYGVRESRRVRREQARQLAKELLKARRESKPNRERYGSDLLWAIIFLLIHIPWTYIVPEERPWSIAVAWALWASALFFLARLFLRWSLDRGWSRIARFATTTVASAMFLYFAANSIRSVMKPSYLYVAPTRDLIEGERRAFFVMHEGSRSPRNVEIELRDNKSGVTEVEKFAEIDATRSNLVMPQYFWYAPSTRWDEDYTVTIASSGNPRTVQHLIVRATQKVLQYALLVSLDDQSSPVIECRDALLPTTYHIAENSKQTCDNWMNIPPEFEDRLQAHTVQSPDGSLTILREAAAPTPQVASESVPDTRHLSEWQGSQIKAQLSRYPGHKILIMASSGGNTWSYAQDFRKVFISAGWRVTGPNRVEPFYESMIDVQLSANESLNVVKPEVAAIRDGFARAAIKRRKNVMLDPEVSPDEVVLWVGAKSPEGISPDDCAPFRFKRKTDDAKPCTFTRVAKSVSLPPP